MICIHHNDLDGRCAAAIVVLASNRSCACLEMDYRKPLPEKEIGWGEEVYIVDFSLQIPGDWEKLLSRTQNVVWIDHHESAIKKRPDLDSCLIGVRDTNHCGAWLTWQWFNKEVDPPYVIKIVDLWDRWKHNDADEVLHFVSGMKSEDQRPSSEIWELLLNDYGLIEVMSNGKIIQSYEAKDNASIVSDYSYPIIFEGFHCLACNSNRRNSKVFDSVPVADKPDIFIAYVHDGKTFTVSLYSEHVKVNDIAMKYGGGGHPQAAGFICEKLPW